MWCFHRFPIFSPQKTMDKNHRIPSRSSDCSQRWQRLDDQSGARCARLGCVNPRVIQEKWKPTSRIICLKQPQVGIHRNSCLNCLFQPATSWNPERVTFVFHERMGIQWSNIEVSAGNNSDTVSLMSACNGVTSNHGNTAPILTPLDADPGFLGAQNDSFGLCPVVLYRTVWSKIKQWDFTSIKNNSKDVWWSWMKVYTRLPAWIGRIWQAWQRITVISSFFHAVQNVQEYVAEVSA